MPSADASAKPPYTPATVQHMFIALSRCSSYGAKSGSEVSNHSPRYLRQPELEQMFTQ